MYTENLPLSRLPQDVSTLCSNVHNVAGAKGRAGAESCFPRIQPGESLTIAEFDGPAIITRFWLTFDWPGTAPFMESMLRNRSVFLNIYWDDADEPAVSAPVGDFFCHPLGYDVAFENSFFSSPVGRSLLCYIPMPFRKRARVEIVNKFDKQVTVFHDIRMVKGAEINPEDGYLHACFRRTIPTQPGLMHDILPAVKGRGRYLGTHLGIIIDRFNPLHWHGAQPQFYFDDDSEYPSIIGASLDDFGGSSWAYDTCFMQQDSGLPVSRNFSLGGGHFGMYFYHRRDPMYFNKACRVCIRPAIEMQDSKLLALLQEHPGIADRMDLAVKDIAELQKLVDGGGDNWFECGRMDDISSVALYYLDRPEGDSSFSQLEGSSLPAWQWPAADAHKLLP